MFALLVVSCGKESEFWHMNTVKTSSVESALPEEFSYSFSGYKCSTGVHTATSFISICQKLTNDELNDDCAKEKREELFYSAECPGEFI